MGECILITGASGAIGSAIALELAGPDMNLLLHYAFSKEQAEQVKRECKARGAEADILQADLSKPQSAALLFKTIEPRVDKVVYACGTAHYQLFQEITQQEMSELIQLHLGSAMELTQLLLPAMIHRKKGCFVFVSSIWGQEGAAMEVVYSTVKSGINGFVKALSKETARSGIRINAVAPGVVKSKMIAHLSEPELRELEDNISAGRIGKAEEVASSVEFLLSERASYVHGHILKVDGGW
ncbi:elongation factor P 5-aminopentanone reductase [Alteribacillus sp. HJP-4]|uniref:elongation factor P 5-aminopentanone reductase n=1 Tax=Alteribacillus sp. HJP-4 TaxID=2775394 RepID=UPI0035CD37B9